MEMARAKEPSARQIKSVMCRFTPEERVRLELIAQHLQTKAATFVHDMAMEAIAQMETEFSVERSPRRAEAVTNKPQYVG